jgi:hypothetical protein
MKKKRQSSIVKKNREGNAINETVKEYAEDTLPLWCTIFLVVPSSSLKHTTI